MGKKFEFYNPAIIEIADRLQTIDYIYQVHDKAIEAAKELQAGGRHSNVLNIGDNLIIGGLNKLIEILDKEKK